MRHSTTVLIHEFAPFQSSNNGFGSFNDRQRGGGGRGRGGGWLLFRDGGGARGAATGSNGWSQLPRNNRGRVASGPGADGWWGPRDSESRGSNTTSSRVAADRADLAYNGDIGSHVFYSRRRGRGGFGRGGASREAEQPGAHRTIGDRQQQGGSVPLMTLRPPTPPATSMTSRGRGGGGVVRGGQGDGGDGGDGRRGRRRRRRRGRGDWGGGDLRGFDRSYSPSQDSVDWSDLNEGDMLQMHFFIDRFISFWDNYEDDDVVAGVADVVLHILDQDNDLADDFENEMEEEELEERYSSVNTEEAVGFPVPRGPRDARRPPSTTAPVSAAKAEAPKAEAPARSPSAAAAAAAAATSVTTNSHQPLNLPSCPVCLDTMESFSTSKKHLMATFCGHLFCSHCINRVEQQARAQGRLSFPCPVCQTSLRPGASHHSIFWS